ncbi:hypothetical protein JCM14036_04250 [Desulfotomaculum defluvii]
MYNLEESRPDMLKTGIVGWGSPEEQEDETGIDFYENWHGHW